MTGTHRIFILHSQCGAGSSPGSCLSGGGTETRHVMARLKLWPWAPAGGGSKDQMSLGTDQMGAVEVVDGRRCTGSIGEGLQRLDYKLCGNLGFKLEYVQKYGVRQLYL
jgi:hypothetical protein